MNLTQNPGIEFFQTYHDKSLSQPTSVHEQSLWEKLSEQDSQTLHEGIKNIRNNIIIIPGNIDCDEILSHTSAELAIREAADGSYAIQAILRTQGEAKRPDFTRYLSDSSLIIGEYTDRRYDDDLHNASGKILFCKDLEDALTIAHKIERYMHPIILDKTYTHPTKINTFLDVAAKSIQYLGRFDSQSATSLCKISAHCFNIDGGVYMLRHEYPVNDNTCYTGKLSLQKIDLTQDSEILKNNYDHVALTDGEYYDHDNPAAAEYFKSICLASMQMYNLFTKYHANNNISIECNNLSDNSTGKLTSEAGIKDLDHRLNTLTIDGIPENFPRDINVLVQKLARRLENLNKSADRMLFFDKELADKFSAQATQYCKLLVMCNPGKTTPGDVYQYIQDNCPDIMKDFTESDRHTGIEIGN